MFVYGDSFQWAKHGHHILPSSLDWTSHNKASLHRTFWNSLIEFLCTDLDGNLSSTLNPFTASRLDDYLSSLQEGLSETANRGKLFDQQMWHQKSKDYFIAEIACIALLATQIPPHLTCGKRSTQLNQFCHHPVKDTASHGTTLLPIR
jgi:hypothetical protein